MMHSTIASQFAGSGEIFQAEWRGFGRPTESSQGRMRQLKRPVGSVPLNRRSLAAR
jgi:hypothetical protein